jgi:hypothetical protein
MTAKSKKEDIESRIRELIVSLNSEPRIPGASAMERVASWFAAQTGGRILSTRGKEAIASGRFPVSLLGLRIPRLLKDEALQGGVNAPRGYEWHHIMMSGRWSEEIFIGLEDVDDLVDDLERVKELRKVWRQQERKRKQYAEAEKLLRFVDGIFTFRFLTRP